VTSLFSYLHSNLKVTPLDDDQVQVTVTLPSDHFQHFAKLLDSLTGFVQIVKRHTRQQRVNGDVAAEHQRQEAERNLARYYKHLVELFDHYTAQGLNRNAAIKQIGADLRAEKHPWSSPDLIRPSLVAAGRGGKSGRPLRQS
jgi:hypothetical protein